MRPEPAPARVVSVGRNAAWIAFDDEPELRLAAMAKGVLRLELVPGDLVTALPLEEERVVIVAREPRSSSLERTTAGGRVKTMAANVDGIAIVAALARPPLHLAMIDELLAFAELHDLAASLVLTKPDLAPPGEDAALAALYGGLGYRTFTLNPQTGDGVRAFAAAVGESRTLLIGQSGVGKSSLFEALGGIAQVGDVSKIGRGKQTTTTGRLHRFAHGFLIDSPGVGEFELAALSAAELAQGFVEIASRVRSCRFTDCRHRTEPGCAVLAAVAASEIAKSRYASYRAILDR